MYVFVINNIHHWIFFYDVFMTSNPSTSQIIANCDFSMNHLVIKCVLCKLNPLPCDMNSFNINYPLQVYLSWTAAKIPWWLSYLLHLKLLIKNVFMVFELKLCLQQWFFSDISYKSYWNGIIREDWWSPVPRWWLIWQSVTIHKGNMKIKRNI